MIVGFVVNTYDALNYDIDFPDIDHHHPLLENIIKNEYGYKNIDNMNKVIQSYSYRCRLNGIEIKSKHYNRRLIKQYSNDIKKLIDRYDGQVWITIKGQDIFHRLLIDIHISPTQFSLGDWLLDKSLQDKSMPFVKYNAYKYFDRKY